MCWLDKNSFPRPLNPIPPQNTTQSAIEFTCIFYNHYTLISSKPLTKFFPNGVRCWRNQNAKYENSLYNCFVPQNIQNKQAETFFFVLHRWYYICIPSDSNQLSQIIRDVLFFSNQFCPVHFLPVHHKNPWNKWVNLSIDFYLSSISNTFNSIQIQQDGNNRAHTIPIWFEKANGFICWDFYCQINCN